jgi:hypothetical protein
MSHRPSDRRGYALMLVMLFVVLFGAMLGIAWRRVASVIRIEHVCEVRRRCDNGSVQAVAQAMKVLETRLRLVTQDTAELDLSDPSTHCPPGTFICKYAMPAGRPNPDGLWYKVTFAPTTGDGREWSISAIVADPSESYEASGLPVMPGSPP